MSLEKLAEDISRQSKSEAEKHIREGRGEASRIQEEARKAAEWKISGLKAENDAVLAMMRTKEIGIAEIERRKIILQKKEEALEALYRDFFSSGRAKTFGTLCEIGRKLFPQAKAAFVSKKDMKAAKNLLKGLVIKESDREGLILESSDGKESLNLSMDAITEAFRARTMKKAYKLLFQKG